MTSTDREAASYMVVFNFEEQYSVWPAEKTIPLGWSPGGKRGSRAECLAYIKEVWTDMRPLSLRKRMENAAVSQCPALEKPRIQGQFA